MRYRLRHAKGKRFTFITLVLLFFILLFALYFNKRIRPVMTELIDSQIDNIALQYISEAVKEELEGGLEYGDIVTLDKNFDGNISAIQVNMAEVNKIQADISISVLEKSNDDIETTIYIPLGTILGQNLSSGRGPEIGIRVIITNNVEIKLKSSFTTAGINQTYHRIIVEATVGYKYFIPGKWQSKSATSDVVIAETVIMGSVPESYTYFGDSYGLDEAVEDYYLVN